MLPPNTFPTADNCSVDDPQEMFLPLLVAWPLKDARIAFPVVYLRLVSERLHQLGAFMRCPECGHTEDPKQVWRPPAAASPHWLSDAGSWEKSKKQQENRTSKFDGIVPTREQCDLSEPREMFAWMLAGLPAMRGAPMLFDSGWAQDTSEHLHDGGAMLRCPSCDYAKPPEMEYVAPNLTGSHWLTSPGEWLPAGEKPPMSLDDEIDASLAKMSVRQQAELFKALEADEGGRELPSTPAGEVVARIPAAQKAAILKRMRDRDTA